MRAQNRALRTNATTQQVLQVAVEDVGHALRETSGVPAVLLQQHQQEQQQLVTQGVGDGGRSAPAVAGAAEAS